MKQMGRYDIIIIGAGASGLAAAIAALEKGRGAQASPGKAGRVLVLERNGQPARKILATGNGRCNYSNEASPYAQEVIAFLRQSCGIEPAEEEGRIYPRSMEAFSVAEALISCAQRLGAEIKCGVKAESVQKNAQGFLVKCEDGSAFEAEKLILATGGKAGIQYGCYGDGYGFAQALGHSVVKPIPALDGLAVEEDISDLHGVRVAAKASLYKMSAGGRPACKSAGNQVCVASESGEVQFTKNGISGICVMDLSRYVRLSEDEEYVLSLDLFPDEPVDALAEKFAQRKQRFGCGLSWLVPEKLKEYMCDRIKAVAADACAAAPGGRLTAMAALAKDLRFGVTGTRGWKTAQVTCGGVPLGEVDPESFSSKFTDGLYLTGELLDYDGPCGGFNLSWAFHTGIRAGRAAAEM